MMRNKIIVFLMRIFLRIFWCVPINEKKICLLCFDGSKLGYDAKALSCYATENKLDYEVVWLVKDKKLKQEFFLDGVRFEVYKSLRGIMELMTSRVIIYNVTVPPQIPYRRKQIFINTWHGFGNKKVGRYADGFFWKTYERADCMPSHAQKYTEWILRDSFLYSGTVLDVGVPRNDVFFSKKVYEIKDKVKDKFCIEHKNIVLYAPTFRGDFEYAESQLDYLKVLKALETRFGGEWVLLYRLHPLLASKYSINDANVIDVSDYDDMQELLCASDVLITDYSSCSWDYSLLKRPIFIYAYDMEQYDRGAGYVSYDEQPYILARSNEELYKAILKFDEKEYLENLKLYSDYVGSYEKGIACEGIFEYIQGRLKDEK